MKVNWVIEDYAKDNSFRELQEAVEKAGHHLIKINGDYDKNIFKELNANTDSSDLDRTGEYSCVVFNGSIKMAKLVRQDLNRHIKPVLYCDWPKYLCSSYYTHYGPYLFNDEYCMMTLGELERQKFDVWGHYGKDALIFVRPDSGDKSFQAGLLDLLDLSKFMDAHEDCRHDLVLVSTPKNIQWEGRFVVSRHKEIISHSTYRFQGQITSIPSVPPKSIDFCKEILKVNYIPDSVFCIDLCQDGDGAFRLLELTSFSSAGLYACDKNKIVENVSRIALEDFNL